MSSCKGYRSSSCWLERKKGSEFCGTCLNARDTDALKALIASPPQSLEPLLTHSIHSIISTRPQASYLDQLLNALYSTSSRHILKEYIQHIQSRAFLLLRFRNHTRTPMCRVYGWIIRNNLVPQTLLPLNCIVCMGNSLHLQQCSEEVSRMIRHSNTKFDSLVRNTYQMIDGEERMYKFTCSLIECDHLPQRMTVINNYITICSIYNSSYSEKVYTHPLLLQYTGSKTGFQREFIKKRIAPWREELTAKVWHPSRFQHWCLNNDEKNELIEDCGEPLMEYVPVRPGLKAEWDIDW